MITKPTLIIDELKCKKNIEMMVLKAQKHHLGLRPHFKTHQSLEIGRWFKELGVNKITVSSISMANYFSEEWNDITVAFPVNLMEINTINELSSKINLNLVLENLEAAEFLSSKLVNDINLFVKTDVGYHRTGVNPTNINLINSILEVIDNSTKLKFQGFLGHAGHTYQCRSKEDVVETHKASLEVMKALKERYNVKYPNLKISLGDTPSCSIAEDFNEVDEIRPGNFVFYDLTQNKIGSNTINQIAVAMACPIVAKHKERNEMVIYGGGVHLSKDRLEDNEGTIFGRIAEKKGNSWGDIYPNMYLKSLSQEHGIISAPSNMIDNFEIGDYLMVLPIHSCMTANLMKGYHTFNGKKISSHDYLM